MASGSNGAARLAGVVVLLVAAYAVYGWLTKRPARTTTASAVEPSVQEQREELARVREQMAQAFQDEQAESRRRLQAMQPEAQPRRAADPGERQVRAREAFVERFEASLVDGGLKPESVSAVGPDRTTLHIQGLACPRGFLSNIESGPLGSEARDLGFKRMTCTFEQMNVFQEL